MYASEIVFSDNNRILIHGIVGSNIQYGNIMIGLHSSSMLLHKKSKHAVVPVGVPAWNEEYFFS